MSSLSVPVVTSPGEGLSVGLELEGAPKMSCKDLPWESMMRDQASPENKKEEVYVAGKWM
jgi:hypothetical protein